MIEYIDNKDIKSFDYDEFGISDGSVTGVCELGKCAIEAFNKNNKYSHLKDMWIQTKFGKMYIYENNPDQANETIKFECYDSRYKLDKEYNSSLYSFPMTLRSYRNEVLDDSGLEYSEDDTFPNANLIIEQEPYVGERPTNRDVIKIISQAALSIVAKTYDDIYYFTWFDDDNVFEISDCLDLTTDSQETDGINLMVLGRGDVEDNVYYPIERPADEKQFRIDNNYILDRQEDEDKRYDVIQVLYNRINGFKYVTYDLRTTFVSNKLSIKLGSKVRFYNRNKESVESYVMNKNITYLGGNPNDDSNYEVSLSAEEISETNTEIKYAASIKDELLRVERKADKNSGLISDTIEKVEENKQSLTKVEQDAESIRSSVSNVENNISAIENSVTTLQTSTYTKTEINTKLTDGSVTKVSTMSGTFDENGMLYEKSNAPTKSNINHLGIKVENSTSNDELLFAGYDEELKQTIVRTDNLTVGRYFVVGANSRLEDYEEGGGIFIL